MKILFSIRPDWEEPLRAGLAGSAHSLHFAALTEQSIQDHDIVVPLTIPDIEYLDSIRPRIAANPLPIPALASVRVCDDKLRFNETMLALGFGDCIPAFGDRVGHPHVLKKRHDESGAHSFVVRSADPTRALMENARAQDYFRQELIPGACEYTTHLLFARGRIRFALHIETTFAGDACIKGRDPCLGSRAVPAPCEPGVFAAMLAGIGFEGLCCINYKLANGRPRVFEINPRIGWSLCAHFARLLPFLERRALGDLRYFTGRALQAIAAVSWSGHAASLQQLTP